MKPPNENRNSQRLYLVPVLCPKMIARKYKSIPVAGKIVARDETIWINIYPHFSE
jgi:hypothetical protein